MAQSVGRGIALHFQDRGTRRGWVVSSTPRPYFTPGKDPVPIVQEAGWASGPIWTGGKPRANGIRFLDRPARSQSLYRLSYPAVWRYKRGKNQPMFEAIFVCCNCVHQYLVRIAKRKQSTSDTRSNPSVLLRKVIQYLLFRSHETHIHRAETCRFSECTSSGATDCVYSLWYNAPTMFAGQRWKT